MTLWYSPQNHKSLLHLFPFLHLLWGLISHVSYVGCRLGLRCSTPVERPGAKISLLWLCEGGKRGIVDLNWCGSWDQSLRMKGQSVAEVIKGDDPNGWDGLFISPKADKYRQKRDEQKTELNICSKLEGEQYTCREKESHLYGISTASHPLCWNRLYYFLIWNGKWWVFLFQSGLIYSSFYWLILCTYL